MIVVNIDFNSDEAIYVQLCNQIILGIATSRLREGEQLPSVRQLAEVVGVNMHTVNKAYSILQQDGFVKIDRRRGAVVSVDTKKLEALSEAKEGLRIVLARALSKNVSGEELHSLMDEILKEWDVDKGG